SVDPSKRDAYEDRANLKDRLGDYRGEVADLNLAITLDLQNPNIASLFYNRAEAKYKIKDKEGACADWSKAGELGYTKAYEDIKSYCN
ncbi:MAG TPA: hypothetical protein VFE54_14725, partial [Mucilaginibacter sp.]|nr:hypothetical protein [Mucilaginibacter sp.]